MGRSLLGNWLAPPPWRCESTGWAHFDGVGNLHAGWIVQHKDTKSAGPSPLRLRVGVFLILLWIVPFWALAPLIADSPQRAQ